MLRLGLRGAWRERFADLLRRIAELAISTVAQFHFDQKKLNSQALETAPATSQTPSILMRQLMFSG